MREYTKDTLEGWVRDQLVEGERLDFKEGRPDKWRLCPKGAEQDKQRREFLKDVTAMANHRGGVLLYGAEEASMPGETDRTKLAGLPGFEEWGAQYEEFANDLHRMCRDYARPALTIRVEEVPLGEQKSAVVVEVPEGHRKPYMLDFRRRIAFVRRRGTSNGRMDYSEIQDMMFATAARRDQITMWRARRLEQIASGDLPMLCDLADPGRARLPWSACLMIPIGSWSSGGTVDVDALRSIGLRGRGALRLSGYPWHYSAEGAYSLRAPRSEEFADKFVMLHRQNYALERFEVGGFASRSDSDLITASAYRLALDVLEFVARARSFYEEQNIEGPFLICVSLRELAGISVYRGRLEKEATVHRDSIDLPMIQLELKLGQGMNAQWLYDETRGLIDLLCHALGHGREAIEPSKLVQDLARRVAH